jgi:hypothetical protein
MESVPAQGFSIFPVIRRIGKGFRWNGPSVVPRYRRFFMTLEQAEKLDFQFQ